MPDDMASGNRRQDPRDATVCTLYCVKAEAYLIRKEAGSWMRIVQHGTEQISDVPLDVMLISEVRDFYREIKQILAASKFQALSTRVARG
ncbi:hypothetical protein E4U19_002044 [Claviceps sp. Clav32 group G5]|nr:hypothetical protein E4U19_002044 [Claviceps sp. Clav32 group G5]KAG6044563.1 hypothetical protein E4U39_003221 [Claviceps sp. Clav50 group G5]